jgi:hypothetical protein
MRMSLVASRGTKPRAPALTLTMHGGLAAGNFRQQLKRMCWID